MCHPKKAAVSYPLMPHCKRGCAKQIVVAIAAIGHGCVQPVFRRSCAMELSATELSALELSRAALESLGPAASFRRFFRRTALEDAERKEAGEGGESKHERGLLPGEI
jgi:hypothetical protein